MLEFRFKGCGTFTSPPTQLVRIPSRFVSTLKINLRVHGQLTSRVSHIPQSTYHEVVFFLLLLMLSRWAGFLYILAFVVCSSFSFSRLLCLVVVQLNVHAVVDLIVVQCDVILEDVVPIRSEKQRGDVFASGHCRAFDKYCSPRHG